MVYNASYYFGMAQKTRQTEKKNNDTTRYHQNIFQSLLKIADDTPIFKKGDPQSVKNYRPVSIGKCIKCIKSF